MSTRRPDPLITALQQGSLLLPYGPNIGLPVGRATSQQLTEFLETLPVHDERADLWRWWVKAELKSRRKRPRKTPPAYRCPWPVAAPGWVRDGERLLGWTGGPVE